MADFDERLVRRESQPLVVGAAHDPAEHEADAVAAATVQRLVEQEAGEVAAATPYVHPVPAGRVHRSAHGAHDEFQAPPEIDARIRQATGGGRPLDADVRRRFEGATGRDLGNVRVHDDGEADRLNRAVSAKAFTTGNDIFFSQGSLQPGSREGQHLLAHELAHTAQQGGSVQRTIRRFSLDDADFTKTTKVRVFDAGGSGNVAQFDDGGKPLIVKVDQLIGNEVTVANALQSALGQVNGGSGGFSVKAPASRLATAEEKKAIAEATLANITGEPRNFLDGLKSTHPTVLMEKAGGMDFSKVVAAGGHSSKGIFGPKLNKDSIVSKLLTEPGPLTTLAQSLPGDVVMGMLDRLVGLYNPDNFMFDAATSTFNYVDNTQNGDWGFLTAKRFGPREADVLGARDAFMAWTGKGPTRQLQGDTAALAQNMWDTFIGDPMGGGGLVNTLDAQTKALFVAGLGKNGAKMLGWMKNGIEQGKTKVMGLLVNPLSLVSGVPEDQRGEALQNLLARRYFLANMTADKAWTAAGIQAQKLLNPRAVPEQAPQRPTSSAPSSSSSSSGGGTKTSTWTRGQRWKTATPQI